MVAGQHDAVAAQQRNPAARLRRLARLVDHQQVEPAPAEHLGVQAGRRRAQDRRGVEDALDGLGFQACASASSARASWRMSRLAPGSGLARVHLSALRNRANASLSELAGLAHVGVVVHHQVERVFAQLRQDAGGMAQADGLFAVSQQPFEQVVHGEIAGAQTSTLSPRRTAWRISSTSVVVLPVPGGP